MHEVNNLIWSGRTLQLLCQHVEIAHSLKGWPEQLRLSAFQLTHFVAWTELTIKSGNYKIIQSPFSNDKKEIFSIVYVHKNYNPKIKQNKTESLNTQMWDNNMKP